MTERDVSCVRDALYGALLGDALGVPHEFKAAAEIPRPDDINLVMPSDYLKTYPAVPYGTWSDDGSQLLCLLDSLASGEGSFDAARFSELLLKWRDAGYHQARGVVFDCGLATDRALDRIRMGTRPGNAGNRELRSNGNGSLMRCMPSALATALWGISEDEAINIAVHQSAITHAHPISQACCAVYVVIAIRLLEAPSCSLNVEGVLNRLSVNPALDGELSGALEVIRTFGRCELSTGSGYVIDSLWSAIRAIERASSYLEAVRGAISYGNDTDTTACITGGLAALRYGITDVPDDWWDQLSMPIETEALLKQIHLTFNVT